ncbi:MAG: sigma-70 family RNA polymerase sigma factor [Myxococcota bacterium]
MDDDRESDLVTRLKNGDEAAFREIVSQHNDSMLRVARAFVKSDDVAEEVVQETWMHVYNGIGRFEGRSSFKTWLFTILRNRARTRGTREARTRPVSSRGSRSDEGEERSVDVDQFDPEDNWVTPPSYSELSSPSDDSLRAELFQEVQVGLEKLPENQRMVVTLRDLLGWSSNDVQDYMEISEANQRVLLHRGRARLRKELTGYMAAGE